MYHCDICPQRSRTLPEQSTQSLFKSSPSPPPTVAPSVADVNFQYLKHVVIKFLCSREDEALQLIRAISTLLEFSPQEEEHVKNYLSYRVILIINSQSHNAFLFLDVLVRGYSSTSLSTFY